MRDLIERLATAHEFDVVGIAPASADPLRAERLTTWLEAGSAGEMDWMARDVERRASPQGLWSEVKSIIMLGTNYGVEGDPLASLAQKDKATLALYAMRRDYHDVIKSRLKAFARDFVAQTQAGVKVFVDTAPVMEKPLAVAAGLGWQGKHSVLVNRDFGNWLLLGAIYTTLEIEPDAEEKDHCGSCRRCLDICPTNAFPAPYTLESRLCISYLTIEHKGPIARDLREKFGNRVFGCDDCLAICPWNKFAKSAHDVRMAFKGDLAGLDLGMLAGLDDAAFRALFAGTPIKRTGRERFVRNVLISIGNSGEKRFIDVALARLEDTPLVRGAAIWALSKLMEEKVFLALAQSRLPQEDDADCIAEWQMASGEVQ